MKGLIHVYCGDGKGKTTASIGLAIRACGCGYQVIFAQFMKSWDTGELNILGNIEHITVLRGDFPTKFSKDYTTKEREAVRQENNQLFQKAVSSINPEVQTLLVFDEIIGSMDHNLMDSNLVYEFLRNKPAQLEIVMTGRNPSKELVEIADYVSEIKKIKHPMDVGIKARKGIEF
jgi:cob(I)alamin adenosyltransferase